MKRKLSPLTSHLSLLTAVLLSSAATAFSQNVNVTNPENRAVWVRNASGGAVPAGSATAAKQDTGNTSLASIDSKTPASPATAGNQTSANTKLDSIITNTTMPVMTRFRNTAVTSTAVAVKASGGNLYGWNIINLNVTPVYVKFYNIAAASVTVGTSTVTLTLAVPASGAFFVRADRLAQQNFTTAISVAVVTGLADNSTAAPVSAIHVSAQYD